MDRTEFAHKIFLSQDERNEEHDYATLLISKVILESENIDEFVCNMYYWVEQFEEAISEAEFIEDTNTDTSLID